MSFNPSIRRYQCRHIFTDGHRCGSPCLTSEDFCFYHNKSRQPRKPDPSDPYNDPPNHRVLTLPIPEDHSAIQLSLGEVMNALARNALDPRRAGLLLYALQIASANLKGAPRRNAHDIVQDVTEDPTRGPLAPESEMPHDELVREFLNSLDLDEDDDEDYDDEEDDDYIDVEDDAEDQKNQEDQKEQEDQEDKPTKPGQGSAQTDAITLQAAASTPAITLSRQSSIRGTHPNHHQPHPGTPPLTPATEVLYKKVPPGGVRKYTNH